MNAVLKDLIPPLIVRTFKPRSKYGWFGDLSSWDDASKQCTGYSAEAVLEKVKEAIILVKNGQAVFERDSVLFDRVEYSWPLLAGLMWAASQNKGTLNVLDFGGSLGSSYYQNKCFLDTLEKVKWNVVEQKSFVSYGKLYIQNETIRFFNSIEEAISINGRPDVFLIACTLPYLSEPLSFLESLTEYKIPYLILDNTFFNYEARHRICIQKVNPLIYDASYPCWFLNYTAVTEIISKNYFIISEHYNESTIQLDNQNIRYRGFIAKHKDFK